MEKVAVKYIGHRETYTDGAYGSRIAFTKGQSVLVPADLAAKLLRHPDVYTHGEDKKAVVVEVQEQKTENEDSQAIRDRIARLSSLDERRQHMLAKDLPLFKARVDHRAPPTLQRSKAQVRS